MRKRKAKTVRSGGPQLRFLVVERDPAAQGIFRDMIERLGHEAVILKAAETPAESVRAEIERKEYDVIIANLYWIEHQRKARDLTGVFSDFKRGNPRGRIYAVSSQLEKFESLPDDLTSGETPLIDACIKKPVNFRGFSHMISRIQAEKESS